MKKTRAFLSLLLCALLLLGLVSCGSSESADSGQTGQTSQSGDTSDSQTETDAEPEEELVAPTVYLIQQSDSFAGGSGTESDPYQISNASELALLSYVCSEEACLEDWDTFDQYHDANFVLTQDIVLNDTSDFDQWSETRPDYDWRPIGTRSFDGTFDGQGHTISGLYLTEATGWNDNSQYNNAEMGLFGNVNGTVQNVKVDTALVQMTYSISCVGTVVGCLSSGTVENCAVSNAVVLTGERLSLDDVGGLVGVDYSGTISNCSFQGTMEVISCGGIAGGASGDDFLVENCTTTGTLTVRASGSGGDVGGILGTSSGAGVIQNCVSRMNIVAADGEEPNGSVGGVIGQLSFDKVATLVTEEKEEGQLISSSSWEYRAGELTVSNCANEGVIQADLAENVGGVIGNLFSFYDFEGNSIQLQDCANRGTVQGGTHSGGVVGYCDPAYGALVISGCRNEGQVTSTSGYAGGIVGYTSPGMYEFTVTGCENVGGVNGAVTSGGILGCYFGFSTKSLKENQTALTITKCVNSGVVSSDSGISGTGGIVGGIQTVQIANAVVVEQCQNTGTVQSLSGGRVGGILGSSALIINANPGPFYTVRNCVNSGSLVMGDGEQNFADTQPKSGDPDSESASVENDTILVLGAMSVGGIVGYHQQGVIENCVNTGTILLDSKMAVRDVAAAASGSDDDDVTSVFAGAIAGFFLYMDDETYQAARITDCQYDNSAPQALSQMSDSEAYAAAVTGVTAVPAAQAQAAAASALN